MIVRTATIAGLFLSVCFAVGCQNFGPQMGQNTTSAGLFGPHVAGAQPPAQGGNPFINSEMPQDAAMNNGHVRLAGMQQQPLQATSNASPTIVPASYQPSAMPAGYPQPAGTYAPAMSPPLHNNGWTSSQTPAYTSPY
jgi:hypothetical protein